jgi:hypothetical protein
MSEPVTSTLEPLEPPSAELDDVSACEPLAERVAEPRVEPRVEPLAELRRDFCCRKNMLWATALGQGVSEQAFIQALERHGFTRAAGASPIAGLSMFEHGTTGHRVVYVARTGRIQIRLDPLTSHEDRTQAAEQLYELLRAASREASEFSDSAAAATAAGL